MEVTTDDINFVFFKLNFRLDLRNPLVYTKDTENNKNSMLCFNFFMTELGGRKMFCSGVVVKASENQWRAREKDLTVWQDAPFKREQD